MLIPDAGDICILNTRTAVPLYPEKAAWVLGGKNKGIYHGCEIGHKVLPRISGLQWQDQASWALESR